MAIPLISAILPVYNGEDHLKECIQSVLDQTYKNFEFIITDDASTDSTAQILKEFAKKDTRIKILTHKVNQKQTAAANTAIKAAKGKYLARMDADDVALPHRFARQFTFLEDNPNVGLLGSWVDIIDDSGKILKVWKTNQTNGRLGWNLLFGSSFAHSSVMMKRDLVEQVGFYQSPEAEDYDLWSRLSRVSEVANLPESLQQKRVWDGQLALKVPTETRDCVLQIMQKNINHLLSDKNLDLEMIRSIRKVSDKTPKIKNSLLISEIKTILLKLYSKYLSKNKLDNFDKKNIVRDLYQKLNTLSDWQMSVNRFKGFTAKTYLAFRFPKFSLYKITHK